MPTKPVPDEDTQQPAPTHTPNSQQAAVQPSGPRGDNPGTAGPGQTAVRSSTPENKAGSINPSAPADTGTVPPGTR